MPLVQDALYRVDNIEIDPAQRCIRRDGHEATPRARVFDLLLYLIENRSRPVTRQELIERIWSGAVISDSVLYKTILEARRVLGDDGDDPGFLKTLPKVGYQFVGAVKVESRLFEANSGGIPAGAIPSYTIPRKRFWMVLAAAMLLFAAAAILWRSTRFALPELPDEEIAWWRFSEGTGVTIKDSAGGATGRLMPSPHGGPPPHWARGRRGPALSLSGTNFVEGNLRLPELSGLTVSAWVRPDELRVYPGAIFDSYRASLTLVPTGVEFGRPHGAGALAQLSGKWSHVVGVDEGPITNVFRIFVDGVERASAIPGESRPAPHSRWRMGLALTRGAPFSGLIDDLRVYARPLQKLEIESMYACGKDRPDVTDTAGKPYYFLPVFPGGIERHPDGSFVNGSLDVGGMQLAEQTGACNVDTLRGADLGQDLRIALDLRVSGDAQGHICDGGPYFRSRPAYPGDGIAGGSSSGYWLKLSSDGRLNLWQLRPYSLIATAHAPPDFDSSRFHRLEAVVRKTSLRVALDGAPVDFEKDGRTVETVDIQQSGKGRGTAGVAFSADANRSMLGGQQARNLMVERLPR